MMCQILFLSKLITQSQPKTVLKPLEAKPIPPPHLQTKEFSVSVLFGQPQKQISSPNNTYIHKLQENNAQQPVTFNSFLLDEIHEN